MKLNLRDKDTGKIVQVDVEPTTSVEVVKLKLSSQFNLNFNHLKLYIGGQNLNEPKMTMQSLGISPSTVVDFTAKSSVQPARVAQPPAPSLAQLHQEAEKIIRTHLQNEELLSAISESDPQLLEAVLSENSDEVVKLLVRRRGLDGGRGGEEFQKKLGEQIEQSRLDQIRAETYEHYPELFIPTDMLFFSGKLNGTQTEIFVDTGAQTTIISRAFAERAGLMPNVDKRHATTVMGVGVQQSLGRIWQLPLEAGGKFFVLSATVLESFSHDVLLGLDMMKRHRVTIDLGAFTINFGLENVRIPFLSDHQLSELKRKKYASGIREICATLGTSEDQAFSLLERTGFDTKVAMDLGKQLRAAGQL